MKNLKEYSFYCLRIGLFRHSFLYVIYFSDLFKKGFGYSSDEWILSGSEPSPREKYVIRKDHLLSMHSDDDPGNVGHGESPGTRVLRTAAV